MSEKDKKEIKLKLKEDDVFWLKKWAGLLTEEEERKFNEAHRRSSGAEQKSTLDFLRESDIDSRFAEREQRVERMLSQLSELGSKYPVIAEKMMDALNRGMSAKKVILWGRRLSLNIFNQTDNMERYRKAASIFDELEDFLVDDSSEHYSNSPY